MTFSSIKNQYLQNIKRNIPLAALAGLCCGFTFFFFGPFDIYAGNKTEFLFGYSDFGLWTLLAAVAVSLALFVILTLAPGKVFSVLFGLFFWLALMGYVQGTFLNIGINFLRGDGNAAGPGMGYLIFNTALWIVTGALCIWGALVMKKHTVIRTAATILMIMILGMQLAGCISQIGHVFDDTVRDGSEPADTQASAETQVPSEGTDSIGTDETGTMAEAPAGTLTSGGEEAEGEEGKLYLSTKGLYEVAKGKNVIVFVIDRFDMRYFEEIVEHEPDFFTKREELQGFTLFRDNVTLYSRTYPAACSMITGVAHVDHNGKEFGWTADEYFAYAYAHSDFLSDLKANGYSIRLYIDSYYGYRDGAPLVGTADNVCSSNGYVISDTEKLVNNMLALSAYRYLPLIIKPVVTVTTASFNCTVQYTGDFPAYVTKDSEVFQALKKNGLSMDQGASENAFSFIHLSGSHTPCRMDENGNYKNGATIEEATRGCFNLIRMYINEMKRLGVFDDATIVITGDHPWSTDDNGLVTEPRLSPVFFKPAGAGSEPLAESSAQVSQDNLIPSLVQSAGIRTDRDYGTPYLEVPEGVTIPRTHKFEVYLDGCYYIAEYTVRGNGHDFSNWGEPELTRIGYLYK